MKKLFYHFVVIVLLSTFLACTKKEVLTPQTIVVQDSMANLIKSLNALKGSWVGYGIGPNFQSSGGYSDSLHVNFKNDGIAEIYILNQQSIGKWYIKDIAVICDFTCNNGVYSLDLTLKGSKEANVLEGLVYNGVANYGDIFYLEKEDDKAY